MKVKKIIMIILLVAFILVIGIVLINISNQSAKNNSSISQNNQGDNISQSDVKIVDNIEQSNANNIIEITDNFFIEQTNDIYLNLDDYIGKTIRIEGLVYIYNDSNGDTCYAVVRNTPGCCGNDGKAGLDIRYDGDYPEVNTWIEVIGVIGTDNVYENKIPAIQVSSMTIKEEGTRFVTN